MLFTPIGHIPSQLKKVNPVTPFSFKIQVFVPLLPGKELRSLMRLPYCLCVSVCLCLPCR